jgi:squalene-hopene/tetraprenyl-beta-curcumene cyclase
MRLVLSILLLVVCVVLYPASSCCGENILIKPGTRKVSTLDVSLIHETRHSLETAFDYLIGDQDPNGCWKNDPAITALVLYSFLLQPSYNPDQKSDKVIKRGLEYLENFVKPNGGIYNDRYKNYTTAVCLLAFTEAGQPKYNTIIENAKKFLIKFQLDEGEGIDVKNPFYGGIGYGGDDRPDLSNLQLALDAIRAAEMYRPSDKDAPGNNAPQVSEKETGPGPHWRKALVFLARTQNIKSVNDMPYATNDGGFIYETGHYKEERSRSYGSMTYAGLKSLLLARVDKEDIRVKKAFSWICSHYTLDENPGFGTTSLYYYYMTAAKCLAALGEEVIVDPNGVGYPWREEFLKKIISLQHEDGYWVNSDGRYWENIKDLATAYAVIGMKFSLKDTLIPVSLQ